MNDNRSRERFLGFLGEEIERRAPGDEQAVLKAFAAEVIGAMDFEDVRDRRPADVCATILHAWQYLQQHDPAAPKISLFNPRFEQHGWSSRHTAVLVLTQGIPFVSESLRLELNRRGIVIHMLVSSDLTVQRDEAHALRHVYPATVPPDRERRTREALVYLEISRISDPALLAQIEQSLAAVIAEVTVVVDDFEPDVRARARARRRVARVLAGGCRARVAREPRAAGVAPGRQLHVPRLRAARGRARRRRDARHQPQRGEARAAARARHTGGRLPGAGARGAGARPCGAGPAAGVVQVLAPLARAPRCLSGLHRGELLRRRGAHPRAALFPRVVHRGGLHDGSRGNPDRAAQGRRGDRALAPEHQQPPTAHAQARARGAAARRAVPERFRHALRHRDAHLPDPGATQDPPVHPHRPAQPFRLLPGVLAARHLPHRAQAEDRVAAERRAGRRGIRVHHLLFRISAGAHLLRDAPGRERAHRLRRRGARGADRAHLAAMAGPARHRTRRGIRRGGGRAPPRALRAGLPRRLPRRQRHADGGGRHPHLRRARARRRAGRAPVPQRARIGEADPLPALQPRSPGRALRRDPDAREPRDAGARRTPLPTDARRPARALGARFQSRLCAGRRHRRARGGPGRGGRFPQRARRPRRERRLQPPDRGHASRLARGRDPARLCAVHEAGALQLFAGVHRRDAGAPPRHCARTGAALSRALRSGGQRGHGRAPRGRASAGGRHPRGSRARRAAQRGPRAARVPGADPWHAAHQLVPVRRDGSAEALVLVQVRQRGAARPAAPGAQIRDLGVFAARGGRAPARRQGRARRAALVGPAGGFPHRGAGAGEGAAGEERGDRAGGRQGRLRAAATAPRGRPRGGAGRGRGLLPDLRAGAARPHRQHRRRRHRGAGAGGLPRRAGSLPGGRRRQGHGLVLRRRQRALGTLRLLAARCLRLRRQRGLRPQEDGDHGARGVDLGAAALSRARHRRTGAAGQRGGYRRHVRRRVRQRHAALARDQTGRGLQPPAYLRRPRSRSRGELRRARAPLRAAALELGRLRRAPDIGGRRRVRAQREVDRAHARNAPRAGH
ncbi:MAG: NAD-glutamate dehydrogenase [Gammaproteobacteria bacterium]|nr:NAD-glutamate dehydrogenase [Gammaproteobacteria bacterium]